MRKRDSTTSAGKLTAVGCCTSCQWQLARNLLGEVTFELSGGDPDQASTGLISAVSAKLHRKTLTSPLNLGAELVYSREKVDKVEAQYQETKLQGRLNINTRTETVVESKFLVQGFDLGRFLRESKFGHEIDTKIDVAADLRSRGDSPHALAANLEGSIGAVLGPGYFSHYLDLLAGGLSRQVTSIWGRHKQASELECAVILFDIAEGVETSHSFFFETKLGVLKGKGQINLGTGTINFQLSPKPKDLSLISLMTKLHVTGSVWHPKVSPDTDDMVLKGVEALSALVVGRAGLLLPFLHLGTLEPHPCDLKSRESQILNIYP